LKYESGGGPGHEQICQALYNSVSAQEDLRTVFTAQLLFWLLAATDGHAKKFSLRLLPGGRYQLTPLYGVLSTWPIVGDGPRLLPWHQARLALSLRAKNRHYALKTAQHSGASSGAIVLGGTIRASESICDMRFGPFDWPRWSVVTWIRDESTLFQPRHPRWLMAAFVTILIVGVADYLTPPQISFSVFYLVPVAGVAWLAGTTGALASEQVGADVTVNGMLESADRLMYEVKSGGKNGARFATYSPPRASR